MPWNKLKMLLDEDDWMLCFLHAIAKGYKIPPREQISKPTVLQIWTKARALPLSFIGKLRQEGHENHGCLWKKWLSEPVLGLTPMPPQTLLDHTLVRWIVNTKAAREINFYCLSPEPTVQTWMCCSCTTQFCLKDTVTQHDGFFVMSLSIVSSPFLCPPPFPHYHHAFNFCFSLVEGTKWWESGMHWQPQESLLWAALPIYPT